LNRPQGGGSAGGNFLRHLAAARTRYLGRNSANRGGRFPPDYISPPSRRLESPLPLRRSNEVVPSPGRRSLPGLLWL